MTVIIVTLPDATDEEARIVVNDMLVALGPERGGWSNATVTIEAER